MYVFCVRTQKAVGHFNASLGKNIFHAVQAAGQIADGSLRLRMEQTEQKRRKRSEVRGKHMEKTDKRSEVREEAGASDS